MTTKPIELMDVDIMIILSSMEYTKEHLDDEFPNKMQQLEFIRVMEKLWKWTKENYPGIKHD